MKIIKTNSLSLDLVATCGLIEVDLKLVSVEIGNIIKYNLMQRKELPYPCFELQSIMRTNRSKIATMEFVLSFSEELVPWFFQITQKEPIIFIAGKKQTLQYKRIAEYTKPSFVLTTIKGTISGGPPIRFFDKITGGSKDEQISILKWMGS